MLDTKRMRFPINVIVVCIRWYAAYPLSYRHLEEMMLERGVQVDHSSINRWAIRFLPLLEKVFENSSDKSGANKSAIDQIIEEKDVSIVVRQVKYLNNIVEQDHRALPRLPFNSIP